MSLSPSQDLVNVKACTDPLLPLLLNLPQKYMLRLRENPFYEPPRMFAPAHRRDRTRYCEFHNDHGHDTNDCVDLRKEIETCVRWSVLTLKRSLGLVNTPPRREHEA
ncbi:hypothetical protein Tco_1190138 [Tanacetum coccineum]